MTHPADTNYIIIILADAFTLPESYGVQDAKDQADDYCMIDDQSENEASDISYTPGAAYPAWILAECPNAPNCTYAEAKALVHTKGDSGSAWCPVAF